MATFTGTPGNDTISGTTGADAMTGYAGNDTYIINNSGDTINETSTGGIDTVRSLINYTLGAYLENLTLTGTNPINAGGNSLNNLIVGNISNNQITGGDGDDSLNGGNGDDSLHGGNGNDTLIGAYGGDTLSYTEYDTLNGGDGDDLYYSHNSEFISEEGHTGNDTIVVLSDALTSHWGMNGHANYTFTSEIENVITHRNKTSIYTNLDDLCEHSIDMQSNNGLVDSRSLGITKITTSIMNSGPMQWWIAPLEEPANSMVLDANSNYTQLEKSPSKIATEIRFYDQSYSIPDPFYANFDDSRLVLKFSYIGLTQG